MEQIQFGPLLQRKPRATPDNPNNFVLVPVWPSTPYEASATASRLSLSHKDQTHQVVRSKLRLAPDVYLQKIYRNDHKGIIIFITWWNSVRDDIDAGVFKDDDPQMDQIPPGFWFGSSGRGTVSTGERGCASLDSARADKDAPDGYLAGAQKWNIKQK